ncbi:MAG: 3-carboxy-cis,cis-muconate cycloisomerase [Devosia sp.]|nr:3-carboxy-cis,cis-muconate cycloisomerase [Devosia sp.]
MTATPFDHPLLSGLLGDDEVAAQFSAAAELEEYGYFEAALAHAEAAEGVIPPEAAEAIAAACADFAPDLAAIRTATARDGVAIPEFVRQLRALLPEPLAPHLHFGATSQDVVDTALIRRLSPVLTLFAARIEAVMAALDALDRRYGKAPMLARTRMQQAIPITVSDRLAEWRGPLPRHLERLRQLQPRLLLLQFGGAAGTLDKLGPKGPAVARRLAAALDLGLPDRNWQTARDNLAELAAWLALLAGSLGKIGIDIALMAQNEIGEVRLEGGGTSSAMPHKSNPVAAEVLVTLARHAATLAGGMQQALVHEQERSGAAWTLEWLILPQLVLTTGASLRTTLNLLGRIVRLGKE